MATKLEEIEFDKLIEVTGLNGKIGKRFYPLKHCACGAQIMPRMYESGARQGMWEQSRDFANKKTCGGECAKRKRVRKPGVHRVAPVGQAAPFDAVDKFLFRRAG